MFWSNGFWSNGFWSDGFWGLVNQPYQDLSTAERVYVRELLSAVYVRETVDQIISVAATQQISVIDAEQVISVRHQTVPLLVRQMPERTAEKRPVAFASKPQSKPKDVVSLHTIEALVVRSDNARATSTYRNEPVIVRDTQDILTITQGA